jgi:hypothetical protein
LVWFTSIACPEAGLRVTLIAFGTGCGGSVEVPPPQPASNQHEKTQIEIIDEFFTVAALPVSKFASDLSDGSMALRTYRFDASLSS